MPPSIIAHLARWPVATGVALLLSALAYLFLGAFVEDNVTIVIAIFHGYISSSPVGLWISDYYTFLIPIIAWGCEVLPGVPVFGLIWAAQLVAWLAAVVMFVAGRTAHSARAAQVLLWATALLLLTEALSHHIVRFSIIASCTGLLFMHERQRTGQRAQAIDTGLFMLGLFMRMHSAIIMLAFFMAHALLTGRSIADTLRAHRWHMAVSALLLVTYQLHGVLTENMGKVIEANYEYALLEKERIYPLAHMQTHADSVRHAALRGFLLSDSAQFTQEFLDRAVDLRYYNDTFTSERLRHATQELGQRISEQWPVHTLWVLLLLLGMLTLGPRHPDMRAALAATGLFWAVIIGLVLVLVDEMKPRFMEPFAGMALFMVMLRLLPPLLKGRGRVPMAALLGVCIAGVLVFKGNVLHEGAMAYRQHEQWALEAQERFRACSAPYRVMGFMYADVPFAHGVFHRHSENPYATLGFFDGGYMVYFPHFKHHFSGIFHCSPVDYPCMVDIIRSEPDIRFYATGERLQTVADYFRGMYGVEMSFMPEDDGCDLGLNAQLYSVEVNDIATPQ